jgi:hypothetical protein
MVKATFEKQELAYIIQNHLTSFTQKHEPLKHHLRVLNAIGKCRTAALGGHVDKCNNETCNYIHVSYNSCRNRHCPKCQTTNKEKWIEARMQDLLPTSYFHVVFTIPHELNTYCIHYPKELYNILFAASKQTIETFSNDPKHLGAQMGMVSVLHTWGQNLSLHPHVHMIVPGGGITQAGFWKNTKSKGKYLFPAKAMSIVYKNKFMEMLKQFLVNNNLTIEVPLRKYLYNLNWVVYAKQPFAGPAQVVEYLGRYTHKVAISNNRIKEVANGKVLFSYKDYADHGKQKLMSLDAEEFLRRFCLHILPPKFMKIRHYGILASRVKPKLRMHQLQMGVLAQNTQRANWKEVCKIKLNFDVDKCPCCKSGTLIRIMSFSANAPPVFDALTAIKNEASKTKIILS